MLFDPENPVVKRCAEGIMLEGSGDHVKAKVLFADAWKIAKTNLEKFTAAHYLARHQASVVEKLHWDTVSLKYALLADDAIRNATLPSIYLNIAKCHEDLQELKEAEANYNQALSHAEHLPDDGYGNMIKAGILNGLKRIKDR